MTTIQEIAIETAAAIEMIEAEMKPREDVIKLAMSLGGGAEKAEARKAMKAWHDARDTAARQGIQKIIDTDPNYFNSMDWGNANALELPTRTILAMVPAAD